MNKSISQRYMISGFRYQSKVVASIVGFTVLSACVVISRPLWRIDQVASSCPVGFSTTVSNNTGEIYQACSPGSLSEGWIRKLSSDANEVWRQRFNFGVQNQLIAEENRGVVLFHDNSATWFNADGTQRWSREIAPSGSTIRLYSRMHSGRFYVAYTLQELSGFAVYSGIMALDESGNEVWSHLFNESENAFGKGEFALLNSGELMLKVVSRVESNVDVKGALLVFDASGNTLSTREIDKDAQLIDNSASAFLVERNLISKLDASGLPQWTHLLWQWPPQLDEPLFYNAPPCAGDGEEKIACAVGNTVTWLGDDGEVINQYAINAEAPDSSGIRSLIYQGDHTWIAARRTERRPLTSILPKTQTYDSIFVVTDRAILKQRINLLPSVETTYPCTATPWLSCADRSDGESVSKLFATADRLFVVGNTTVSSQNFVSAYILTAY